MIVHVCRPVVAGVDGSPASLAAADWAAREALRRQVQLRLVHAYVQPAFATFDYPALEAGCEVPLRHAAQVLADAADRIRREYPGVRVQTVLVARNPAGVLVDESRDACLVVVGARGEGGFAGLSAGSVSTQVAMHAYGPVVVVSPSDGLNENGVVRPVVVGLDGSAQSTAALGFAFDTASTRGAALVAIYAWQALPTANLGPVTPWHYDPVEARTEARRLLMEQLAGWSDKYPQVPVEPRPVFSLNPAETLVEASRTAGLVVVGCRGRGGFVGLLLGSTSRTLVHHAHCTIAVVHPTDAGPGG
jgi:nucleotide-binding universal stress UspA family protein